MQPWGRDAYKRKYWLIEGQGDTHFRLYRESNPGQKNVTWWSVAGNIPELKAVADKLVEDKSMHSKRLSEKIHASIPRFEGSEEVRDIPWLTLLLVDRLANMYNQKRKRRDYRIARKAAFTRPEPGFSLYEGRTRGKKLKYTYSDEEDDFSSDAYTSRKSTRLQSGVSTPAELIGPTYTASGRQVRTRVGGAYGESSLSGRAGADGYDGDQSLANGRSRRTRASNRTNGWSARGYNVDDMEDESEATSSGKEWEGNDEDINDYADEDEEMSDGESDEELTPQRSLVVQLRYGQGKPMESTDKKQETDNSGVANGVQDIDIKPKEPSKNQSAGPNDTSTLPAADDSKETTAPTSQDGGLKSQKPVEQAVFEQQSMQIDQSNEQSPQGNPDPKLQDQNNLP